MPLQPESSASQDEALEVLDTSSRHGLGVRTLVPRRAGEVVHHFTGVISPELRLHSLQVNATDHISETRYIGFLSHSCDPNCRLDMDRFELQALRDVEAGGLLTIDYAATEDVLYRQFECHCGAVDCRRWITGRAEEPNAEGLAYLAKTAP
jgi:SET domain-containing protein